MRVKLTTIDREIPYVVYCDTGRRSSAAAFILLERGFDAYVLRGMSSADSALLGPTNPNG
jgi:rhodanese-related sulfurtransferase